MTDLALTPSKARLKLWLKLLKVTKLIEGDVRDKLRTEHASTLPRFDVMAALFRNEQGMRMSDLSTELMVSNGNVTGIIDRLVVDGLVHRSPVQGDRRALMVSLTSKGRKEFNEQAGQHEAWVNSLFQNIPTQKIETLTTQMEEIAKSVELAKDKIK